MTAARRAVALATVAVLAVAIAAYVGHRHRHHSTLPAGAGPWNAALAAPFQKTGRTACGVVMGAGTVGVGHPVLPCGVRLYVRYGDRTVLTTVIDRGDVPPGRELNLTPKLAELLGVQGAQTVRWRFTR
ncbi:MAG: RlpA-like double-psi beta-barrel domain-containing protein [Gaiellaceae bacterium]